MVQWSLLAAVIVVLIFIFVRHVRVLQGQAELSTVKSTLQVLRMGLLIDHLQNSLTAGQSSVALRQRNPFDLLQQRPSNYLGEMSRAQAALAPGGSWVFDRDCVCVGYLPLDDHWFDSPSGDVMAWYAVNNAPGPLRLTAKESYVWQGGAMR